MKPFAYRALPWNILFARGESEEHLLNELDRIDLRRIMLIASASKRGRVQALSEAVGDRVVVHFSEVKPHVPFETAIEARKVAQDNDVDGLVCIGGGSTIGTAKIVALTSGLPIIAVPTTFSGSEMTPMWGMTTDGRKDTGVDSRVLPQSVIYDSTLTLSLPTHVAAASGFNALAHSVEALWAPSANPITTSMALSSIEALTQGLELLAQNPETLDEAYELLHYGACLAGGAFAIAGSGLHHKICHALGGSLQLPHAETHSIILPSVLNFNLSAMGDDARRLSQSMGGKDPVELLRSLSQQLGIPPGLRALGVQESDLELVADIMAEKLPIPNPVPVDRVAIESILRFAFS